LVGEHRDRLASAGLQLGGSRRLLWPALGELEELRETDDVVRHVANRVVQVRRVRGTDRDGIPTEVELGGVIEMRPSHLAARQATWRGGLDPLRRTSPEESRQLVFVCIVGRLEGGGR